MGKFLGGLALASAVWAVAWWQLGPGFTSAPCRDMCGEGTVCDGERCAPKPPVEAEAEPDEKASKGTKKRRRRGRKRRGKPGAQGSEDDGAWDDAEDELPPFVPVNDKHIPQYKNKTVNLDEYGSERLGDDVVNQHMSRLNGRFQKCIETAAMYSESDLGSGTLSFRIRLKPDGKVDGVSVKAPANLKVFGIVPCARKVVYDHRFPKYDGPPMGVDFSFDVG